MARTGVVCLMIFAACVPFLGGQRDVSAAEEGRVQAAVLDSFFVSAGTKQLVVLDSTVRGASHYVDQDYVSALSSLGELPEGLREDFDQKRRQSIGVPNLPTRVPTVLIGNAVSVEIRRTARNPDQFWRAFYERYPASSGLLRVSRVGFSRDGRHALMLVDYGCGGLCGGTVYYLLHREGNVWRTIRSAQPRIS